MSELLLLGGGAVVAYLLLRPSSAAAAASSPGPSPNPSPGTAPPQITTPAPPLQGEVPAASSYPVQLTGRWGWPVPRWQGRAPVISDGYSSPRPGQRHLGVDIMFSRIASDAFGTAGPNGSKLFVMPEGWPAIAASDGVLWSAGWSPRGFEVVIHHGSVATYYQHMSVLYVPQTKAPAPGTAQGTLRRIQAGEPLGIIGGDPTNPPHLMHLHFELWPTGASGSAIDPAPLMKTWQVFTPADVTPFFSQRNAGKRAAQRAELVKVRGYERRWPRTSLPWLP